MKKVGFILCVVSALLLAGCGSSEDRSDVRAKMQQAQTQEGGKPEGTPDNP